MKFEIGDLVETDDGRGRVIKSTSDLDLVLVRLIGSERLVSVQACNTTKVPVTPRTDEQDGNAQLLLELAERIAAVSSRVAILETLSFVVPEPQALTVRPGEPVSTPVLPEWQDIPELVLPGDDWAGEFPASDVEKIQEAELPAIGSRVDVPFVQRRIGRVVGHKDGGLLVELPGGTVELVRPEDVQGVG